MILRLSHRWLPDDASLTSRLLPAMLANSLTASRVVFMGCPSWRNSSKERLPAGKLAASSCYEPESSRDELLRRNVFILRSLSIIRSLPSLGSSAVASLGKSFICISQFLSQHIRLCSGSKILSHEFTLSASTNDHQFSRNRSSPCVLHSL
jgi:hypothetical protein